MLAIIYPIVIIWLILFTGNQSDNYCRKFIVVKQEGKDIID